MDLARAKPRALVATAAVLCLTSIAAAAGGTISIDNHTISIDNQSSHPVKVAAPGADSLTLAPKAAPATLDVDAQAAASAAAAPIGAMVRVWWTNDPLQLCQIFTPWSRTLTITGDREIHCRSR